MQNFTYDDSFFNILRTSARSNSTDLQEYINEYASQEIICDYFRMIAIADSTTINDSNSPQYDDLENDGRISLAYENLRTIPRKVAENYAMETRFLDLNYNQFKNLSFLSFFKNLQTLILDRNSDLDPTTFPYLTNLEILWMNNCTIVNIPKWIYRIQLQCPNLRHLSLIGNPGARTQFSGATCNEETDFRNFIADMLPNLIYLDGQPIRSTNPHELTQQQNRRDIQPTQQLMIVKSSSNQITRNFIKNSFRDLFRFNVRKTNQSSSTS